MSPVLSFTLAGLPGDEGLFFGVVVVACVVVGFLVKWLESR